MKRNCLFVILFAFLLCARTVHGISIFSSKPGEPDTSPSIQLILRNIGFGLFTDPVFNRLRKRLDFLRTSPILQAILPNAASSPAAQAAAQAALTHAVRMLRNRN